MARFELGRLVKVARERPSKWVYITVGLAFGAGLQLAYALNSILFPDHALLVVLELLGSVVWLMGSLASGAGLAGAIRLAKRYPGEGAETREHPQRRG